MSQACRRLFRASGLARWFGGCVAGLGLGLVLATVSFAADEVGWVTAWTTAPLAEKPSKETPPLQGATIRQFVRVTAAGSPIRLRLGNYFGAEPLVVSGVRVSVAASLPGESEGAAHVVKFGEKELVSVPPGEVAVSDPLAFPVEVGATLAVSLTVRELPSTLTVHSAARSNSLLYLDDAPAGGARGEPAQKFTRWYFLSGIEVYAPEVKAVALLGDSITDGYGTAPDSYTRWPDFLFRQLQSDRATRPWAVLNLGIGGNRLLRDGLGPRALDRVDRDVFAQPGVRSVVIFLGINDLGTRLEARKKSEPFASAEEIIAALTKLAQQSRERGLRVVGATITPYRGADFYWSEDGEADRQTINRWIRGSAAFDAVLDFDAALRDPAAPDRLAPAFDSGDHLHPSVAGYEELARASKPHLILPEIRRSESPASDSIHSSGRMENPGLSHSALMLDQPAL